MKLLVSGREEDLAMRADWGTTEGMAIGCRACVRNADKHGSFQDLDDLGASFCPCSKDGSNYLGMSGAPWSWKYPCSASGDMSRLRPTNTRALRSPTQIA